MKVYVDELPESCCNCPCLNSDCDYGCSCNLNAFLEEEHFDIDKKPDNCPLQSLTDYTKQVRKEVCEEIRKEFLYASGTTIILANNGCIGSRTLEKFLDQIQGETKC